MNDVYSALADLLRAHAPALVTAPAGSRLAALGPDLALVADLGFDQIALAELALAAEDALGVELDLGELVECATVERLARLLRAKLDSEGVVRPLHLAGAACKG